MEMDQYPAAHRTDWNPGKISEPVAREKASYSYDSGVWFGVTSGCGTSAVDPQMFTACNTL
jgi:hypothetical protein